MNMYDRFDSLRKIAEDAIDFLEESATEESECDVLIRWMLETDANPYSFLKYKDAKCFYSAEGMERLVRKVIHAVEDEGNICFVTINGEPTIVFEHVDDPDLYNKSLSEEHFKLQKYLKNSDPIKVEVLDIKPNEFPAVHNEYFKKELKKLFIQFANLHGVEQASDYCSKYSLFDDEWVNEATFGGN